MMHEALLVAHIAVLGYWLGSELVINSLYRFICSRSDLPFVARDAQMDHLMDVDQHVRYALILQLGLGGWLLASLGLLPSWVERAAPLVAVVWLALVEIVHRTRKSAAGLRLAAFDRASRYAVMAALVTAAALAPAHWPLWLRLKLALFAGVMACGVGIRLALIAHFRLWADMQRHGPTPERDAAVLATYWRATAILALLWAFIAAIVAVSILKP